MRSRIFLAALVCAALFVPVVAAAGPESGDLDGDGIADSRDRCEEVEGVKSAEGCPDADGDGFGDLTRDRCPGRAGDGHGGCPVVDIRTIKPRRHVTKRESFTPTGKPSVEEVHEIAAHEQSLWGGVSGIPRMECESGLDYSATNGQYRGLGQFGGIWSSMYPGTPRKVVLTDESERERPVRRITVYGDGSKVREVVRRLVQVVTTKRVGQLPAGADPYHGWTAIRVVQRAISGHGPTTYWACTREGSTTSGNHY